MDERKTEVVPVKPEVAEKSPLLLEFEAIKARLETGWMRVDSILSNYNTNRNDHSELLTISADFKHCAHAYLDSLYAKLPVNIAEVPKD